MQTKQFIKTTLFVVAISAIVIFSKQIQREIIENYNHCVDQLASRNISSVTPLGF